MLHRTDDLRIKEIKELAPPAHLLRELALSEKPPTRRLRRARTSIASCMAPMIVCW